MHHHVPAWTVIVIIHAPKVTRVCRSGIRRGSTLKDQIRPGLDILELGDSAVLANDLVICIHITHILQCLLVGIRAVVPECGNRIVLPPVYRHPKEDIRAVIQFVGHHVTGAACEIQLPEGGGGDTLQVAVDPSQSLGWGIKLFPVAVRKDLILARKEACYVSGFIGIAVILVIIPACNEELIGQIRYRAIYGIIYRLGLTPGHQIPADRETALNDIEILQRLLIRQYDPSVLNKPRVDTGCGGVNICDRFFQHVIGRQKMLHRVVVNCRIKGYEFGEPEIKVCLCRGDGIKLHAQDTVHRGHCSRIKCASCHHSGHEFLNAVAIIV